MSDFKAKMHQIRFRWGSLQRSPDPLAGGEGFPAPPQEPHFPLSTLLVSTPLFSRIFPNLGMSASAVIPCRYVSLYVFEDRLSRRRCYTDRRDSLLNGRSVITTDTAYPRFVAMSLRVSKEGDKMVFFWQFILDLASLTCVVNSNVHWCVAVPFISGYCLLRLHGFVVVVVGSRAIS